MAVVWAYCRVSTRKEEQEDSLDTQHERAAAFAAQRGFELRAFQEQASAKSITSRPVLSKLLAELENLPVRQRPKYLFVTALDRLSRDMVDGMYVGRILRALKITLYVDGLGEKSLNTFAERAVFVGESMGGDAENEAKSKRMRDSWERRRREGKTTSNKVPYGMQLQGERDVPIADSAEWVLKAFEWYAQGIGSHVIGKRMMGNAPAHTWLTTRIGDDGERISKTRAGTRWDALRVVKLLRQRRYRGTIVSAELFDEVQRRFESVPKFGSRRIREYPLSGAMKCEGCGRHLHGAATGNSTSAVLADGTPKRYPREPTRYYACVVCNYRLNAIVLETAFFETIGDLVADERLLKRWVETSRRSPGELKAFRSELKALERELSSATVDARRDRLFDLAISASIDDLEFRRQSNRLEGELTLKRERLANLRAGIGADEQAGRSIGDAITLLRRYRELYGAASYEMKREIVNSVVDALGGLNVSKAGLRWKRHELPTAE